MEKHISVLLNESISSLNLDEDSIIVDATLGYGGHSSNILDRINKGYLFAFDQDSEAIRHSTNRLNEVGTNFTIIKSNFCHMQEKLKELLPLEKTLSEARKIENLHEMIRNNEQKFNLTMEQEKLAEILI